MIDFVKRDTNAARTKVPDVQSDPRQKLPRTTAVGLGLIMFVLVANMFVSQWNTHRLIENEQRVIHTEEVLTTLQEVLALVTEAETAERGFLITGDADYLKVHRSAVERTAKALGTLTNFVPDVTQQHWQIEALEYRVRLRFDELDRAIAAKQSEGFDAARLSVATNQGRKLMNEMRGLVDEMQHQEQEILDVRASESQHSAQVTIINDLVGSLLGIGMVGLAFLLFRRELMHRQRADDATRRLAAIVESSDDAIISKNLGGVIVSWNAGAERIYGYSVADVIGRPITLLSPPERINEINEHLELVQRGVHIDHFKTTRVRKDGRRIDVSLSISPIKSGKGKVIGASAISRDVTDQIRLQREVLEIASREQQRIGQDLHDGTGQELSGLAMMTQRLAADLAKNSLPQSCTAAKIVDGLEQALRNVRALSRGLVPVEVDSQGLMVALSNLAGRTSELHDVDCTFECQEPVCILNNQTATHLYRLSQEAVTNAVKHGHSGRIWISLATYGDLIVLKIIDDGNGFAPAHEEATGTGLRIMRYRAELIQATLTFSEYMDHGTVVTCTVPQARDPGLRTVPEFRGV